MRGRFDELINLLRKALQLQPINPDAHWNSALAMLLAGDYKNGWEKYEWRTNRVKGASKPHALPKCDLWSGDSGFPGNNKLMLVTKQGLGDTLQLMRYATTLRNQGFLFQFASSKSFIV